MFNTFPLQNEKYASLTQNMHKTFKPVQKRFEIATRAFVIIWDSTIANIVGVCVLSPFYYALTRPTNTSVAHINKQNQTNAHVHLPRTTFKAHASVFTIEQNSVTYSTNSAIYLG